MAKDYNGQPMIRNVHYLVLILFSLLTCVVSQATNPSETLADGLNLVDPAGTECQDRAERRLSMPARQLLFLGVPVHASPVTPHSPNTLFIQGERTALTHTLIRYWAAPFSFRVEFSPHPLEMMRGEGEEPLQRLARRIAQMQNFSEINVAIGDPAPLLGVGDRLVFAGNDRVYRLVVLWGGIENGHVCFDEQSRRYVIVSPRDLHERIFWHQARRRTLEQDLRNAERRLSRFMFPDDFANRISHAEMLAEVLENVRLGYQWLPLLGLGTNGADLLLQVLGVGGEIRVLNGRGVWQNMIFDGQENGLYYFLSPNLLVVSEDQVNLARVGYSLETLRAHLNAATPNTIFYRQGTAIP